MDYRVLIAAVALMVLASGCTAVESGAAPVPEPYPLNPGVQTDAPVRVEVYHFHLTRQCSSCIAVGALAEKTVNTFFSDELASGRLAFAHVNLEDPAHRALVERYGAAGSSLWIGTYVNGTFYREQDMEVWYLTGDEAGFTAHLRGLLERRLAGDLT